MTSRGRTGKIPAATTLHPDGGLRVLKRFIPEVDGDLAFAAAIVLLLAWATLGLGHTAISMTRGGFESARPPAVGAPSAGPAGDVAALHDLLAGQGDARVYLQLAPSADTAEILYLRYQLAHTLYPLRVRGGRPGPSGAPTPADGFDLLVTGRGAEPAPGWTPRTDGAGYRLWGPSP